MEDLNFYTAAEIFRRVVTFFIQYENVDLRILVSEVCVLPGYHTASLRDGCQTFRDSAVVLS